MENSRFNSLPVELRIKAYEYALTFDRVSCRPHKSSRFWPERSLNNQLALTRVCKQIRAECQLLLFTLNNVVVGEAPSRETQSPSAVSSLHVLADEVAKTIASISSGLISKSTVLSLDLTLWAQSMFRHSGPRKSNESYFLIHWVVVKLFFGRLLRSAETHKFLIDITPNERVGIHPWCDAGEGSSAETDRESCYELQPEIAAADGDERHFVVAATFNTSRILATADQHWDHDRSLCNATKHGDALLARMAELERAAGTVIDRETREWNTTSPPRI